MQLIDLLKQGGGIAAIARQLGVPESQAAKGASALMPSLLAGMHDIGGSTGRGLDGVLGTLGGGDLYDRVLSAEPADTAPGTALLGQVFGNQEDSRAVVQQAATSTGLDASMLQKMLPLLAMLVGGYLAKHGGSGGALSGLVGTMSGNIGGGGLGTSSPLNDLFGKPRR